MGPGPFPARLVYLMSTLEQITTLYSYYDTKLQAGSPAIRLNELKVNKEITVEDFQFIDELIKSQTYTKRR